MKPRDEAMVPSMLELIISVRTTHDVSAVHFCHGVQNKIKR